ncbi:MAG: 3-deoxy-7-phosphoheptulonate synthase [Clostridia bacterium]|nr:3-deoxy-7-phosphoheptulonate synthase [Clostridia bacterium]MBQ4586657.1 3-deoxy-7-phosphoheptulonate synthase [Clostridia bacterium]MBQ6883108.1 3-deoxy-7-phosphoheptulonate synthase [Clostridia bacterium]
MIIVVKNNCEKNQFDNLVDWIKEIGLDVHISRGAHSTVLGLVGSTEKVDIDLISSLDIVEQVQRVQEPYKNANRKFHPEDTIVRVGDIEFGGDSFQLIAGPCSVESESQIIEVAKAVKASGAKILRGGAFKPRTSPYAFQGLKGTGIELLLKAKEETGLPVVTELISLSYLDMFDKVDVIQIGARNMQNFELLKEVGKTRKPILLKRGLANTLQELLMSAEYIMSEGNDQVILCERGIRTFETMTRNTLDLSAVPVLREKTHLPIIIDPSHATGVARLVEPMSLAAVGAGADGLIIEVHNDPKHALCDGAQSITPEQFDVLAGKVNRMLPIVGRKQF